MTITYRLLVSYEITREGYAGGTDNVVITRGYTTVQDIPKMIGIRRGVTASEVVITLVTQLS
jgi:hypothetical protein